MTTQCVPVFKSDYLSELRKMVKLDSVLSIYREQAEYPVQDAGLFKETHVIIDGSLPELTAAGASTVRERAGTDVDNAILLYSSLGSIGRVMASDHRLWAYLSHGPYFRYCQERWPFRSCDDPNLCKSAALRHVKSHWFFARGLRRNAVCRLWWAADLTYSPWTSDQELARYENDDDFYYTRKLLGNQDIYGGLLEGRSIGRSSRLLIVAMDVIYRYENDTGNFTKLVTEYSKSINLLAKHTDLGSLPAEVLDERLDRLCCRIKKKL